MRWVGIQKCLKYTLSYLCWGFKAMFQMLYLRDLYNSEYLGNNIIIVTIRRSLPQIQIMTLLIFFFLSLQVEASLDIDPDNEDLTKLRNDLQVSHVTM